MRAVGYIRVSTELQAEEGFGLDIQRDEISEYCTKHGYKLVRIYSDEGRSGADIDRLALNRMLNETDYDVVIVSKYDRLARDLFAQLFIEKELKKHDIALRSIREDVDGMPEDMRTLMRQMMGAFAEFEKKRIAQRLSDGRTKKRKLGGFAGGRAPLGYVSERDTGRLHINTKKIATIRRIFDLRASGATLKEIADRLNAEGHMTQDDARFTAIQVKRALDREDLYRGKLEAPGII